MCDSEMPCLRPYHPGGNVSVGEDGFLATYQRQTLPGKAVLTHCLRDGIVFTIDLEGTGVIKMTSFSSKAEAIAWMQAPNLPIPANRRLRNSIKNRLRVTVSDNSLVFTPDVGHRNEQFFLPLNGSENVFAFGIESGEVAIFVGNFRKPEGKTLCGPYVQLVSQYVDVTESESWARIALQLPNPFLLCTISDFSLSPGHDLQIHIKKIEEGNTSGSYIRFWLRQNGHSDGHVETSRREWTCGKPLFVKSLTRVTWTVEVRQRQIIVHDYDSYSNQAEFIDSIMLDNGQGTLNVEIYKVSVAISRPLNDVEVSDFSGNRLSGDTDVPQTPSPYLTPVTATRNVSIQQTNPYGRLEPATCPTQSQTTAEESNLYYSACIPSGQYARPYQQVELKLPIQESCADQASTNRSDTDHTGTYETSTDQTCVKGLCDPDETVLKTCGTP